MSAPARVTPLRRMPEALPPVTLSAGDRTRAHMAASLLLDYPDEAWFARLPRIRPALHGLDARVREPLETLMDRAEAEGPEAWQAAYVATFDLKRRCSLYLSYYATGDTRRRGAALVTFLDAYRAAGWRLEARELPDYLPAVLEFSAVSGSPIARDLLASHREGLEVLLAMDSPWAGTVGSVTMSLPPIDERTRERYLTLVNEGPPTELVGLGMPVLPPFAASSFTGGEAP